ncbi:MAG: DNA repair and recombination protein RadA, partial [Nitrososphaerota archaeon]
MNIQPDKNRGLNPEETLKHIHLIEPETTDQLLTITENIPAEIKPKLIIIDGLTTILRTEYIGRETLPERQSMLRQVLTKLRQYARKNNVAVIITNQVYASPEGTPFLPLEYKEIAVGGHSLYHYSETRIFLRKGAEGKRIAKLVDSSHLPPQERP